MSDLFGEVHHRSVDEEIAENGVLLNALLGNEKFSSGLIFDVGCGKGGWSLALAERGGKKVMSSDICFESVQTARSLNKGRYEEVIRFACSDMTCLPFASNLGQLVFCWGSIHYTPSPENALKELLRVCHSGGQVWVMGHAETSLSWLHRIIKGLVNVLPTFLKNMLLEICILVLRGAGLLMGSERLKGDLNVRQKLTARWFYPGILHFLRAADLIAWAREAGWRGEEIPFDFPNRYNSKNSFLIRFKKV